MSDETFPRWGLPEVDFIETDPDTIKTEIISAYEEAAGRSLARADPVYLFLETIASIIIQLRQQINYTGQQNLLTYAVGGNLDALGVFVDVERLSASAAVTTMQFTLSEALGNAYVIPEGFQVTSGDYVFETDEALTIPAGETIGTVSASCRVAGTEANGLLAGQISRIIKPMTFLDSAENITETTGGADEESDAEYAERIRLRCDSYSVAGPRLAYVYHAKSYSSAVQDVSVFSPTPGEVDVYVLLDDGELPSETFLEGLHDYLSDETIRPFTDYVVCQAPEAKEYDIRVDYWISKEDSGTVTAIEEAVEEAVEEYRLWQQERIGRDITPAMLVSKVMQAGACRIKSETLSPSEFEELGESEIAQCSSVTVNFLGFKDI